MNHNNKVVLFVLFFAVVWITLTALTMTWGFMINWSDYVHENYGFPLVWATHTLDTIAGPVDKWSVNVSCLLLDLIFWQGFMAIILAVVLRNYNSKARLKMTNETKNIISS